MLDSDMEQAKAELNLLNIDAPNWCPPEGDRDKAKVALIGEAPGVQERRLRRPFCGPSGQLLNKLLLKAGIDRNDCYVTNVIKEQPDGNDITPFVDLGKRIPKEGPKWSYYLELLHRELDSAVANILVAVGAVPLYALCGQTKITKRRGSILESTLLPGRKVIPIIHPAAALREHLFTYPITWDLKRIKRVSEFPEITRTARRIVIATTLHEVLGFIQQLQNSYTNHAGQRYIHIDIEILNEEVSCICIGNHYTGTMVIPFVYEQGDYFTSEDEATIWSKLAELLEDRNVTKLGQNVTFDASFIFRRYGIKTFPVYDTMVAQGILFPELPKGLDFLTSIYTDEPYYKDDGKRWFKSGGSFQDLWLYNGKDGDVLPEIHSKELIELKKHGNIHAYQMQLKLIEPLVYMSERGIKCDVDGIQAASKKAEEKINQLTEQLHTLCGFEINPGSPKQLADYFYITKKYKPYTDRKTGNITTSRDALKRLARKGAQEASLILEIRAISKMKGTYYDIKIDTDDRLRCAFNPVGTTSGRLSSSKNIFGSGGNLQNIPSEFKQYMKFDQDYIGYNVDLSQAENRTVAYVAPDSLMIEAFEHNLDIHALTASLIFGVPYDQIKEEDEKGIYCEIGGGIYTRRFWGKKANHGLNYDLGFRTFSFYYEIPEREGQFIVERYHRAYPGVRQYHAWVRNKLSQGRILENCLGRKRLFLDRWGDELFKLAYSFIPQSTIADKVNHFGVIPLYYDAEFHPTDLLNQVHDSLVFQIPVDTPIETHVDILMNLRSSLESPLEYEGRKFSIPMDIEAAPNGGNMAKASEQNPCGLHKIKGRTREEIFSAVSSIFEQTSNSGDPNGL